MNCAEKTADQVDREDLKIINYCYAKAVNMLTKDREVLDGISDYLFEHETITGKEFKKMFREMKGHPEPKEEEDNQKDAEKGKHIDMTADDSKDETS